MARRRNFIPLYACKDWVEIRNCEKVCEFMKQSGLPYVVGKTWTTDSFYRERRGNFEKRKAAGCISVEMESAVVQAMCDFRGLELYVFFTGGDLTFDGQGIRDENNVIPTDLKEKLRHLRHEYEDATTQMLCPIMERFTRGQK